MNTNLLFRGWIAPLTAMLLVFGLVSRVQAQTASDGAISLLNDAYATLVQANHDYKGHRVKAMKQIEAALNVFGAKINGKGKGHEPQGTSDAQLRSAQALILQAEAGMSGPARKHLDKAVTQITTALSIK
jgi:hypothetical protein